MNKDQWSCGAFGAVCSIVVFVNLVGRPPAQELRWHPVPDFRERVLASVAYDFRQERPFLFGGTVDTAVKKNDLWSWAGSRWDPHERPARVAPSPRYLAMLFYCPVNDGMMVFGGDGVQGVLPLGDQWLWRNGRWFRLSPSTVPSPRSGAGVVFDPARERVVMFGGNANVPGFGVGPTDETWEWDGRTWRQILPATRPPAMTGPVMAWDPQLQRVIMLDGGFLPQGRTWAWDGRDWSVVGGWPQDPRYTRPQPLFDEGCATHPGRNSVILHGGGGMGSQTYADFTWEWDGGEWQLVSTDQGPNAFDPRSRWRLVADWSRGEVVAVTGRARGDTLVRIDDPARSTWVLDRNLVWREAADQGRPRYCEGVIHDPARDEFVVLRHIGVGEGPIALRWTLETWVVREEKWVFRTRTRRPGLGRDATMVYHPPSRKVLLFGRGLRCQGSNETWLWDGYGWTEDARQPRPPVSCNTALSYDSSRNRIVLLCSYRNQRGGSDQATWEWSPTGGWYEVPTANDPERVSSIAFHSATGRTITLLEVDPSRLWPGTETWAYDGVDWSLVGSPSTPPAVGQMLQAPELGGVACIINRSDRVRDFHQLWVWDGQDWQRKNTANLPGSGLPTVSGGRVRGFTYDFVHDASHGRVRAFDLGSSTDAPHSMEDLRLERLTVDPGAPPPGTVATYRFADSSQALRGWLLALSTDPSPGVPLRYDTLNQVWERLPLARTPLLDLSVQAAFTGILDARGRMSVGVPIPPLPELVGLRVHGAVVTFGRTPGAVGVVSEAESFQVMR